MELVQYAVILFNLEPTLGSEIKKTRPCIIISPDEMYRFLRTLVIAPMATNLKAYPTRISVKHNRKKGIVALDQIRTIDKKRVIKALGKLSGTEIKRCKNAFRETYVD